MALTPKEQKMKGLYELYLAKVTEPMLLMGITIDTPVEYIMAAILLEEYKDKLDALKAKE